MTYLSEHFTLEEFCFSEVATRRGISNRPSEQIIKNLQILANGMEQVRTLLSAPIVISSGYRSGPLNHAIGGSRDSAHVKGLAADFIAPRYGTPKEIARAIAASDIEFDQLIHEGRWVHIAFAIPARREVLTAIFNNGVASYADGLS